MPADELAGLFGSVLRQQGEFKAKGAALVDMNERVSTVARALVKMVDNEQVMVIHTGKPFSRWGVEEPDPAGPARWPDGHMPGHAHDASATRRGF